MKMAVSRHVGFREGRITNQRACWKKELFPNLPNSAFPQLAWRRGEVDAWRVGLHSVWSLIYFVNRSYP